MANRRIFVDVTGHRHDLCVMDVEVDRIARCQYGLITRKQLQKFMSPRQVDTRIARGDFVRVRRGIYRVRGAPASWRQSVMAAVLQKDGVVKGRAAGRLWNLPGCDDAEVEIVVGRNQSHVMCLGSISSTSTSTQLDSKRYGIPVTGIERTIVELSEHLSVWSLGRALDDAIQRKLTTVSKVERVLEEMGSVGRKKVTVLRQVLDKRTDSRIAQTRWLHRRVVRVLQRAGIDDFVVEHPIRPGSINRRLDVAWPHLMLALEVDGYETHGSRTSFDDDRIRNNEIVVDGWTMLHITSEMSDKYIVDIVSGAISLATQNPA